MKTRSPFLALVKWEFDQYFMPGSSSLAWTTQFIYLAGNVVPALALWLQPEHWDSQIHLWLWADIIMVTWLPGLCLDYSTALLREVGEVGWLSPAKSNLHSDEFFVSRAIDRKLHFRAKSTRMALVLMLPLLLNSMLIAVVTGKPALDIADFLSLASGELFVKASGNTVAVLACTLLWGSAAAIVLAQAYYGLASKLFTGRRVPRVVLMTGYPVLFGLLAARYLLVPDDLARSAQFFAANWLAFTVALLALTLPVQRFCERRFAEQEVI